MTVRICSVLLYVRDTSLSSDYYAKLLDMDPAMTNDEVAIFRMPRQELILHRDPDRLPETLEILGSAKGRGQGVIVHFGVECVDTIHRRILDRDIPISLPPTDMSFGRRQMYLYDVDGYNVVVESPVSETVHAPTSEPP